MKALAYALGWQRQLSEPLCGGAGDDVSLLLTIRGDRAWLAIGSSAARE